MSPKVLIADKLSPAAIEIFRARGIEADVKTGLPPAELRAIIGSYDGLAIRSATKVTKELLEVSTNLKVVGRAGIGVDNVDIKAATAHGVVVMNTPFGNAITTAEHAVAMMFALARQLPEASASTRAGKWEKNRFMGVELTAKTLGIIGCGNIGSIVADRAVGLKMKVLAYDPFLTDKRAVELGVEKADLPELFARSDFITLHTPLVDGTRNIINRDSIAAMKQGVRIVNCARGGLVDEAALLEGLTSAKIAGGRARCLRGRTGHRQSAVCARHGHLHAASGRGHRRGAGERGPAGRRADERLPADRRGRECDQCAGDIGGGRAARAPLHGTCTTARGICGPADPGEGWCRHAM